MADNLTDVAKIENDIRRMLHLGEPSATEPLRPCNDRQQQQRSPVVKQVCPPRMDRDSDTYPGSSRYPQKNSDEHSNFILNHSVNEKNRSENARRFGGKKQQQQQQQRDASPSAYRQYHQSEMANSPGRNVITNMRKSRTPALEEQQQRNKDFVREGRHMSENERGLQLDGDQDNRKKKNKKKKDRKSLGSNEPDFDGSENGKTRDELDSVGGGGKKTRRKVKWEVMDIKTNAGQSQMQESTTGKVESVVSSKNPGLVNNATVHGTTKNSENLGNESQHQNSKPRTRKGERVNQPPPPPAPLLEENKPPPEVLESLAKNYIYPLKKRYSKFPKALFYCRLCEYHCDTVQVCNRHMKDDRHQKNKTTKELEITLRSLPSPYTPHTECITELLLIIEKTYGLSDDEVKERLDLVKELNDFAVKDITGCSLRLYGSSLSKFGLKDSDVNVDLLIEKKQNPAEGLMSMFKKLETHPELVNVKSDFTAKIPSIYFNEKTSKLNCVVNLNNVAPYKTACLLADYVSIDPRVRTLGIAFRYWAQLCMVDEQEKGTLPSYSFALMLVYFLQQHDPPVLPVLHELTANTTEDYMHPDKLPEAWTCKNTQSVGELWIELFKFYSVSFKMLDFIVSVNQSKPMLRAEKMWSSKKIAIEDPYANKRNVARSISNQLVADYIFERFKMTYKYFGIPQTKSGPLFDKLLLVDLEDRHEKRSSSSRMFLDVLETIASKNRNEAGNDDGGKRAVTKKSDRYANDGAMSVTIKANKNDDGSNEIKSESKHTKNGKNLSVKKEMSSSADKKLKCGPSGLFTTEEDTQSLNCSHDDVESELSESTPRLGDDDSEQESCILNSLMEALDGDSEVKDLNKEDVGIAGKSSASEILNESLLNSSEKRRLADEDAPVKRRISESSGKHDSIDSDNDMEDDDDDSGDKVIESEVATGEGKEKICNGVAEDSVIVKKKLPVEIEEQLAALAKEDLQFKFEKNIFTGGKAPAMFCGLCQQKGHLKQNCPNEQLPPILPLPPMDRDFMADINEICKQIYIEHNPTPYEIDERKKILRDLQEFIRQIYPDAQLELFGSSCNGFGFARSDLDICLTFNKHKTGEDLKFIPIIEHLAEKLKKHKELYNVIAITTAKVPIVKFTHRGSRLDGDISLYNTLAQHNTRMLNIYSEIDNRVKVLGYVIKVFAKLCNIGDASRGSLSSYAYILMVIYFLQQRNPPVIPVLQELYDKTSDPPERMVDGWNAWFFEDTENMKKFWPHLGKNEESVGELWLGLLCYYTEVFRFQEHVISIRQLEALTRFEKLWNSKCIAIEDPFDLQHNLGAGVSRKMNNYIMKAFIQGRKLFGTPIQRQNYGDLFHLRRFLFNSETLTDGAPPNDRGCRLCGKIGHIVKECPRRRSNKTREKAGQEYDRGRDRAHEHQREKKVAQNVYMRNHPPLSQPPLTALQMAIVQQQQLMGGRKGQMAGRPVMMGHGMRPESVMIPVMMPHNQPHSAVQQKLNLFSFSNPEKQRDMLHSQPIEGIPQASGDAQKKFPVQGDHPVTNVVAALPLSQPIIHTGVNTGKYPAQQQSLRMADLPKNYPAGTSEKYHQRDAPPASKHARNSNDNPGMNREQTFLNNRSNRNEEHRNTRGTFGGANHPGRIEIDKSGLPQDVANTSRTVTMPPNCLAHTANQQSRIEQQSQMPILRHNIPLSAPPGFTHANMNYRMQLPQQSLQQQTLPSGDRQTYPCLPQHGGQEVPMSMHLQQHGSNLPLQPPFTTMYGKMASGENIRLVTPPTPHQQVPATSSSSQFPPRNHHPTFPQSSQQYGHYPPFPQIPRQYLQLYNMPEMSQIHMHSTPPSSAPPFTQSPTLPPSMNQQDKSAPASMVMRKFADILPQAQVDPIGNQICVMGNTHSPSHERSSMTTANSRTMAACFGSPRSSVDSGSLHSIGSDMANNHPRGPPLTRDGSISD